VEGHFIKLHDDITFLISSLSGGGAEGVCVNLANALVKCGWKVTLVVLHLNKAVRQVQLDTSVELIVLGRAHARMAFFALYRFLLTRKPSKVLVFNHQLAVLLVFIRSFLFLRYKIIARNISTLSLQRIHEKSFWHKYVVYLFVFFFYKKVDLIIAQSVNMKHDLITGFGFKAEKVIVINNPINQKIEDYVLAHEFNGLKKDYILCIGRLEKVKAFHYAIKVFSRLTGENPDLRLKIVGQGSLEADLKKQAGELGIAARVDFEGYQCNIIPYYLHAFTTILTSLYEGFPNVLVESIALGTPVVAFDCQSGPGEIIQNDINGFLVRYKDSDHLFEFVNKALKKSWDQKTVSLTADRFLLSVIVEQYLHVISLL
jgi:glycosyltransferase involved in cell wall biosynthesis